MNIKELAKECNGELITFSGQPLCYTFASANLEKFVKEVIKAYVSEQKPIACMYVNSDDDCEEIGLELNK